MESGGGSRGDTTRVYKYTQGGNYSEGRIRSKHQKQRQEKFPLAGEQPSGDRVPLLPRHLMLLSKPQKGVFFLFLTQLCFILWC